MSRSTVQKFATAFAVLATLSFEFFAVSVLVNSISESWLDGLFDLVWVSVAIASPFIVLAGFYLTRRSPILGGISVVGAAVPMGAVWFWFPPFWGLALTVAAIAVLRARRFATAH